MLLVSHKDHYRWENGGLIYLLKIRAVVGGVLGYVYNDNKLEN